MLQNSLIQVFQNNKIGNLRTTADETGKPLFCLADICKCLGLSQVNKVKARLEPNGCVYVELSENGNHAIIDSNITNMGVSINKLGSDHSKGNRIATFIDEPNLYRCIFQSKKDEAKQFQDWTFNEVLPQIRTTGGYIPTTSQGTELSDAEIMAKALSIAQRTLEQKDNLLQRHKEQIALLENENAEQESKISEMEQKEAELQNSIECKDEQISKQKEQITSQQRSLQQAKPKVEYYDMALNSNTLYTVNQIALELGTTAVRLNARLSADGIQYKQGDCWMLTAPYRDKGYSDIRTWEVYDDCGRVVRRKPALKWTEKGRQFLLNKYKKQDN